MEVHLRGYSLSLRRSDAAVIELMDEDEAAEAQRIEQRAREGYEAEGKRILAQTDHTDREDEHVHKRAERLPAHPAAAHTAIRIAPRPCSKQSPSPFPTR